jgi:hypothetical protein
MNPQLLSQLRHLRLSGIAEALPVRLEQARSAPLDHIEFLELIVSDELARRSDRLFARRLKQAGIVQVKKFLILILRLMQRYRARSLSNWLRLASSPLIRACC